MIQKYIEIELMEHNKETYKQVNEQVKLYGRSIVVQPTGTGKSYIMMKILRDYEDVYKVVVGSSIHVLSDLQSKVEWTHKNTFCYTYNNLGKLIEYIKVYGIKIGLICLDEIHRAGAPIWGKYVKELLELCPDAIVIGFTATPIRFLDGKRDMVKEMFNGISAGNLTIQQCVERGILPQATYVVGMLEVRKNIEDRMRAISKSKKSSNEKEEASNILKEYEENWDRDKSAIKILSEKIGQFNDKNYKHIVFVPSIEIANNMSNVIEYWFTQVYRYNRVNTYIVHSKLKNSAYLMQEFCNVKDNNDIDVLICVNMANEGFHVKNTKSITMLRYTNSPNLYLQQIGRGLASGGESPYIFDFIGNIEAISNILEIVENNEVKVSNLLTDNTFEKFKTKSKKLFKEFDDNTENFRKAIKKVDRLVANKWVQCISDLEELINSGKALEEDQGLFKWFKSEQRKFIGNQMSDDKEHRFRSLGDMVYLTETLKSYDKDIINELNNFKNSREASRKIEKVRYLAFIDKLPKEVEKYINDNSINLGIDEEWFGNRCREYNNSVFEAFNKLIEIIQNFDMESIDDIESLKIYEYIIVTLSKFREKFRIYEGRMDSKDALLYNMLNKYWKIHRSSISSHIETDTGTLRNHLLLIRKLTGNVSEDDLKELEVNVYSIPEQLRSRSTNKLIQTINRITSN